MGKNKVGDRGLKRLNILKKGKNKVNYLPAIVVVIAVLAVVGVGVYFALDSGHKAEFEVTSLTLSPAEAKVGQTITASVAVKNNGNATGAHRVALTIGGEEVEAEEVTLAPNETKIITFTVESEWLYEGTYTIGVGELTKVLKLISPTPATFELSNLVAPDEVEVYKSFEVSLTIRNVGDLEGKRRVSFDLDGARKGLKDITLAGGATETVSFTATTFYLGKHKLVITPYLRTFSVPTNVKELQHEFTASNPSGFEFSNLRIPNTEVRAYFPVYIEVSVKNNGDTQGTYLATLIMGSKKEATRPIKLEPGESGLLSFSVTRDEPNTYNVSIEGLTGSFTVLPRTWQWIKGFSGAQFGGVETATTPSFYRSPYSLDEPLRYRWRAWVYSETLEVLGKIKGYISIECYSEGGARMDYFSTELTFSEGKSVYSGVRNLNLGEGRFYFRITSNLGKNWSISLESYY